MSWVEEKYINNISNLVRNFTKKGNVYNFSCPLCGDSQRDKRKARGYVLNKDGKYNYFCHNCGASLSFPNFLKHVSVTLHDDYVLERFRESNNAIQAPQPEPDIGKFIQPKFSKYGCLKPLKRISQLDPSHPAKEYVVRRRIPSRMHYKLFYAPKFKRFVNTLIPDKFKIDDSHPDEPRLIIPFIDEFGDVFGFQGRSFFKDGIRYITIILNPSKPKLFGLESVDKTKNIYITEGPIDSMFLENAVAMAGSDVSDISCLGNKVVFVYDNEPRNKEIINKIDKVIEKGYNVVVWPSNIMEKDINDMVLAGRTPLDVQMLIQANIKKGLEAKLALSIWRKV
jgi:transcription elongation factor Elf1